MAVTVLIGWALCAASTCACIGAHRGSLGLLRAGCLMSLCCSLPLLAIFVVLMQGIRTLHFYHEEEAWVYYLLLPEPSRTLDCQAALLDILGGRESTITVALGAAGVLAAFASLAIVNVCTSATAMRRHRRLMQLEVTDPWNQKKKKKKEGGRGHEQQQQQEEEPQTPKRMKGSLFRMSLLFGEPSSVPAAPSQPPPPSEDFIDIGTASAQADPAGGTRPPACCGNVKYLGAAEDAEQPASRPPTCCGNVRYLGAGADVD
jgi:hypothetical protein